VADLLNPVHAKRYGGGIQRILPPRRSGALAAISHIQAPLKTTIATASPVLLSLWERAGVKATDWI